MRESPSIILMEKPQAAGAGVADLHVPVFPKLRDHAHFDLSSVAPTADVLAQYDCVLLATDHDEFDYDLIRANSRLVVDSRGRYLDPADNIVKA